MKVIFFVKLALIAITLASEGRRRPFHRRSNDNCDVRHAIHALESLSGAGVAFCTSLLHSSKQPTKTVSQTVTETDTCSVRTVTTTEHGTATTYAYSTIHLRQLTKTEYSSTVLIPSGKPRTVNKRAPAAGPATPSALTTCKPNSVTSACSSVLAPVTTTVATTTTHTKHSCLTTTTETVTTTQHTTTLTYPFSVTTPPIILSATGVLTTTVPADCIGAPYVPAGSFPDDDMEAFPQYPDQPINMIECCVVCHRTPNCVALEFYEPAFECGFLIRNKTDSKTGISDICPLGTQDFFFGSPAPDDPDANILPGPCGY